MSHLQQTVSQPRKKSNLAIHYLFIYFQSTVSFQPCQNCITVHFSTLFCSFFTFLDPQYLHHSTAFWCFWYWYFPQSNSIHLIQYGSMQSRKERQKDEKFDKRRQSNTSTCHLKSQYFSVGFPWADPWLRATKGISKVVVVILSYIYMGVVCECVLPQKVPSLCSSYITLFCVGLPTSRLAA